MATDGVVAWNIDRSRIEVGGDHLDLVHQINFVNGLVDENEAQSSLEPLVAHVTETIRVPARSDMIIPCEVKGAMRNREYVIEEKPHEFTVKVGRVLVKTSEGEDKRVPVRILNMGNNEVTIPKGCRIAYASERDNDYSETPIRVNAIATGNAKTDPHNPEYISPEVDLREMFETPKLTWKEQVELLNLSKSILNDDQQRKLKRILMRHSRAFMQKDGKLGQYRGRVRHYIRLIPGTKPVRRRAHRVPLNLQGEVLQQLKEKLAAGLIKHSESPFAAPILLVKKANGSYRFVCDYRGINAQIAPQAFVLPNIQTLVDMCAGKKVYTTVDFSQAYHQIRIYEPHAYRSAFVTEFGLFQWTVCPYGMKNSGETFNRMMQELAKQMSFRLLCFVDDVILCSASIEEHLENIDEFLRIVEENGLSLNLEKCDFCRDYIKYLGVILSERGTEPNPDKIAAILNIPVPTTMTKLKSFLGAFNYFRRHVKNCSQILAPLYEIMKGDRLGEWGPRQQEAFDTAKAMLASAPILAPPRAGIPYVLETDASNAGLGFCLLQEGKDGLMHPVVYGSRCCNKHEKNLHVSEREALAAVYALKECAPYIVGNPTTILRTDNAATAALLTKNDTELTSRMNKYRLIAQSYDVKFEHRSGKSNKVADFLSRQPLGANPEEENRTNNAKPSVSAILPEDLRVTAAKIRSEQRRDPELSAIYDAITKKCLPREERHRRKLARNLRHYTIKTGMVHYRATSNDEPRAVLPQRFREAVIRELHEDAMSGGHLGTTKTAEKVRQRFYWPNLHKDVAAIISGCEQCLKRKVSPQQVSTEPLHKWPVPKWPFYRVHTDLMGYLPLTQRRHRYILTATDALTKYLVAVPLRNQTAEEVSLAFEREVICKFGVPFSVVHDQGKNLTGTEFNDLASTYGFQQISVSAYHQSANGQIERAHSTLANMISAYTSENGTTWDENLHLVTMAFNSAVHSVTGLSPFYALYGREPCLPIDLRTKLFPEEQILGEAEEVSSTERAEMERNSGAEDPESGTGPQHGTLPAEACQSKRMRDLRMAWSIVSNRIEERTALRDAYRDAKVGAVPHSFEEGQLVLRKLAPERRKHKFAAKWDGPYRLVCVTPPNAIIRRLHENEKPTSVHFDQLKPFKETVTLPAYRSEANDSPNPQSEEQAGEDYCCDSEESQSEAESDKENDEVETRTSQKSVGMRCEQRASQM
ncbi:pol polyprotein [Aphelenchoides avenae]|nr:pol polyprotein [Aphelenchus avenae]